MLHVIDACFAWEGNLAGGRQRLQDDWSEILEIIELDDAIDATVRKRFWELVEVCDENIEIQDHVASCCRELKFVGAVSSLAAGECLGTAQKPRYMADAISSSDEDPNSGWLPPSGINVEDRIWQIARAPDYARALSEFAELFGPAMLQTQRIWGFRNPSNPAQPLDLMTLQNQFDRLALGDANSKVYVMFAYRPNDGDARRPTAFDAYANTNNWGKYQAGGYTAGANGEAGYPEVITEPPQGRQLSVAPRAIT